MNKQRVMDLCEGNPQLQWWAMVLFAEVSDLLECYKGDYSWIRTDTKADLGHHFAKKVEEFERLVIQEMEDQTKEKRKQVVSLEQRIASLEGSADDLMGRVVELERTVRLLTSPDTDG